MQSKSASSAPPGVAPGLIGVDWGTSSCRACLLDEEGRIIETVSTDKGILTVEDGAFADTLDQLIGAWRRPGLPVILSGMIGSRQGWIDVPYIPVPASFEAIAQGIIRHPDDVDISIVPGLSQDLPGQAPDVMRGEETQIIGAVGAASDHQLLIMPGTHSKWVRVEGRAIVGFTTFMTGELFALLKGHSILGRLMTATDRPWDRSAFERGLDAARSLPGGLLRHLFSVRTLALFERLTEDGIAAYLSGLLIGHELRDGLGDFESSTGLPPITVIGASELSSRYIEALDHAGLQARHARDHSAAYGQSALARARGLLSPTGRRA